MRLEGKVAIVSGSTRGIGRSIAEMFAREGAKVAVTGRTVDRGEKVVARITEAGGTAAFFPLDITDEDSVHSVMAAVADRFGKLDVLINNGVGIGTGHLTRLGVPDDIAYCATWLASDEPGFVAGSLVTADGGFTINGNAIVGM